MIIILLWENDQHNTFDEIINKRRKNKREKGKKERKGEKTTTRTSFIPVGYENGLAIQGNISIRSMLVEERSLYVPKGWSSALIW